MRGATNVTIQTHQILRLPRKMTTQHLAEICGKQLKRHFQCAADPSMIRDRSENDPRPFPSVRNPPRNKAYFSRSGRAFCIGKCNISSSGYLSKFHQVLRLPRKVTLELHQVLRLPRKVTLQLHQVLRLPRKVTLELHQVLRLARKVSLELHQVLRLPRKVTLDLHQLLRLPHRMTRRLDPRHIWNVISNARSNKCHPPNSPHIAPATQNDHPTSGRNLRKTAETSFPMRGRSETVPRPFRSGSETVPRPFPSVRNLPGNRGYFSRSGRAFCIEKYNISRSGYLSKFHQVLRLPRKVTLELHQVLRLPRKVTLELHQVLRLPRKVTLELHQVLRLPRKVTLELHQVLRLPCKVTLDLHQVLRLPRKVTLDLHQLLRLPHRMTRRLDPRHIWNVISNARSNKCHPPNSPHTAPATQNDHPTSGRNLRKTAETSFPMRGRSETVPRPFRSGSETVPRPFPSVRNPPRNRGYFSRSGRAFCIEKYNISRSGYLSKFHQVLRLPRKVTLELHQVLRLPRKVTLELHQLLRLPRKVTLELHQVLRLPRKVTLELHQVLCLPRKVTLELNQVLRLPRKVTLEPIVIDSTLTQRF